MGRHRAFILLFAGAVASLSRGNALAQADFGQGPPPPPSWVSPRNAALGPWPFNFDFGGGPTSVTSTQGQLVSGSNFQAGAGYNFAPNKGVVVEYMYSWLGVTNNALNQNGAAAGNTVQCMRLPLLSFFTPLSHSFGRSSSISFSVMLICFTMRLGSCAGRGSGRGSPFLGRPLFVGFTNCPDSFFLDFP